MSLTNNIRRCALNKIIKRCLYSTTNPIKVEINNHGIALLTLQHPPVNSLNIDLLSTIKTTLNNLEKNKATGAILTSAFKTFSAGLDVTVLYKPDPEKVRQLWTLLQDVWIALYGSCYPTVAVINGPAPAGACLLTMCCEYRVIVPNTYLGLSETQLGLIAPPLFAATMINTIGKRHSELALTSGKLFSSDEALAVGLVDEIVQSKEEGLTKAYEFLGQFRRVSASARYQSKQVVRGETVRRMIEGRGQDLNEFVEMVQREDVQKNMGEYLENLNKKKRNV